MYTYMPNASWRRRGRKRQGRGLTHPEHGGGRRSAQAERGRLGKPLRRANGAEPLSRVGAGRNRPAGLSCIWLGIARLERSGMLLSASDCREEDTSYVFCGDGSEGEGVGRGTSYWRMYSSRGSKRIFEVEPYKPPSWRARARFESERRSSGSSASQLRARSNAAIGETSGTTRERSSAGA